MARSARSASAPSPPASAASSSPAVELLRERSPGLRLAINDIESPDVFDAIALGELDVALSMEHSAAPGRDDERFERFDLVRDVLDVALPEGHRLAGRELRSKTSPTSHGSRRRAAGPATTSSACRARRRASRPAVAHRSGDWTAIMAMVAAGLGVAVVPRLAQDSPPAGVVIRPLCGEPAARHLFVVCRSGAEDHPAIGAVVGALRDVAQPAFARSTTP